jgi:hypothetical protein
MSRFSLTLIAAWACSSACEAATRCPTMLQNKSDLPVMVFIETPTPDHMSLTDPARNPVGPMSKSPRPVDVWLPKCDYGFRVIVVVPQIHRRYEWIASLQATASTSYILSITPEAMNGQNQR